ncbi:C2 domain-containing protein 3 [Chionoecetes opilio]|uniref:C2 domain-containing protein 3 n=1 Tax=Chionoecetes opilio TaxID=41210 RepID=A0A8J4YAG0_CHIOP|nr:C2 domain-containing protein 3 [Chionoecetes opilio]
MMSMDSSSGSDLSEPKYSASESRQLSQYSKPRIVTPSYQKCTESSEFNSIYLPTHMSPSDKGRRGEVHCAGVSGVTGTGDKHSPRIPSSIDPGCQDYDSAFLSVISEYNNSNNQPVESGGESPCITTATDCCADFIDYNTLGWQPGMEARREDQRGCCRVHLEILKGRNLPWIEGSEGIPQPPNCYARTSVGSVMVLTNVCRESVNPMWNFAADVLLPYSQLSQTNGSLILKVHHSPAQQRTSPDDLLLGFVSVDATSIWSGHVSLCGWYPLLDLRGSVRGHVKVSLTPHEPPLNVAASNISHPVHPHSFDPPVSQQLPRQHYAQCSDHSRDSRDSHTASMYFQGDGVCNSVLNSLAQTATAIPQFTTKNQRELYNQNLQGIKDLPSFEVDGKMTSQTTESSDLYKPVASHDKGEDDSHDKSEECVMYARANTGDKTQNGSRKTSSIPVFASNKTLKSPRPDDKGKIHSNLPKVDYKDKENVLPTTEVISHGYCRHKGSIVVKGLAKESSQIPQHPNGSTDPDFSHQQSLQKEGQESMMKDSLIMNHFRMQKERDEGGEDASDRVVLGSKPGPAHKAVMSSSGSDNSQSDSQHSSQHSATSLSGNKPSSCLKAPGSPSLRVKHVTFAHKLVHHQTGAEKLQSHFSQGEVSWRSHQSSQHGPLTRQDAAVSPRNLSNTHSLTLEGSDLQVVPCREGDPQAHPAMACAQGGITVNGFGTARPLDRTKEDLIMAFSWMNQSKECDTPCVSFIESKVSVQNNIDSNGTCSSKSSPDDMMGGPSPSNSTSPKKSRKLRSRIAANFTLK